MSETTDKSVLKKSYLKPETPFPFCKACGHRHVILSLDEALVKLGLRKEQINITSDLGCVGLVNDLLQDVHTVQTTYGNSTAYALGTAVTDRVLFKGKLKTVVMLGDGAAMAGLQHLVQAARLNVDLTVLLNNNFLYGMSGGQSSDVSSYELTQSASKDGIPPVDFLRILEASQAGFLARAMATDMDLSDLIAKAIEYDGFSLVEIFEVCSFLEGKNNFQAAALLKNQMKRLGTPQGIVFSQPHRMEFSMTYQQAVDRINQNKKETKEDFLHTVYEHQLTKPMTVFIAGTTEEQIQTVSDAFAVAAVKSGLSILKREDSLSPQTRASKVVKFCLSPEPLFYAGLENPDVVIISSERAYREALQQKVIQQMKPDAWLLIDDQLPLPEIIHTKKVKMVVRPFRKEAGESYALVCALGLLLKRKSIFSEDAFRENWGNELDVQNKPYLEALGKGIQMSFE